MTGHGWGEPGPDDLLAELSRWAAAERVGRAAGERSRLRALVDQSAAEATWSGILVDLAEVGAEVTLSLRGARRVVGRLVGTGRDLVVIERARRGPVLVPVGAISSVIPSAGHPPPEIPGRFGAGRAGEPRPGGQRPPALDLGLADALDALGADGAPVTVHTADESFHGVVSACGQDLVTVRAEGAERRPVHIALGAITCVELR
ncbi:MAG: hypothetical protein M0Z30_22505 [Actinomycetota bacterium]|nr:hypothetical protein [Actinomycetota bacterium]